MRADVTNEDFEAFKAAHADYPSQDNEGYSPDRGGFKAGWFAALRWERERTKVRVALYHDPRCEVDPKTLTWKRALPKNSVVFICGACHARVRE